MKQTARASKLPQLADTTHWPCFADLPTENGLDEDYYALDTRDMIYKPTLTWCLLVEIVDAIPWPTRPMFNVEDREGRMLLLAFHLEGLERLMFPKIRETYKKGYTVAIMNAESHLFADGQMGLRVESMSGVKLIPVSYERLLKLERQLRAPRNRCQQCGAAATSKCRFCVARYCNKKCQTDDWKSHKNDCLALRQLIEWGDMDWKKSPREEYDSDSEHDASSETCSGHCINGIISRRTAYILGTCGKEEAQAMKGQWIPKHPIQIRNGQNIPRNMVPQELKLAKSLQMGFATVFGLICQSLEAGKCPSPENITAAIAMLDVETKPNVEFYINCVSKEEVVSTARPTKRDEWLKYPLASLLFFAQDAWEEFEAGANKMAGNPGVNRNQSRFSDVIKHIKREELDALPKCPKHDFDWFQLSHDLGVTTYC